MGLNVFVVAGEASADSHGAALLRELKRVYPDLKAAGVGGDRLRAEGMELVLDARVLNVVGVFDWLDRWREVIGSYRHVCREVERRRPDCAILLDLPDFNLALAKRLKKLGIPVVYYISPQVWAWRKYRIRKIRRLVDRMLVVFPFEKDFYESHGVPVEFTGHPLRESITPRESYRSHAEIVEAPRIVLLPGSRRSELAHHGPVLDEVARRLAERYPRCKIRVPVARTLSVEAVRAQMPCDRIELFTGDSLASMAWADVALVASGTATLETALVGTPFALLYILSPLTMFLGRLIFRYRGFFGMPNLLHGREVVREYIQGDATADALYREACRLIDDEAYRNEVTSALRESRQRLGTPGASARAAGQVRDFLLSRRPGEGGHVLGTPQPA